MLKFLACRADALPRPRPRPLWLAELIFLEISLTQITFFLLLACQAHAVKWALRPLVLGRELAGLPPTGINIRSIATAPHPPRGAQRILYKSFFRPRVSIAPQYIHFSVSGPRIRHNVFLLKTWIAKLPTQYLRHAKLSIVAPCLNACLADTALDQRAVVWPACLGPWHASLQRTRSMDHHSGQCAGLPQSFPWPFDLALHARWPRTPAPTDTVSASRAAQVVVCVYRDATVSAAARLGKHLFPAGHRWPTWPPYQNGHKLLPAMYSK